MLKFCLFLYSLLAAWNLQGQAPVPVSRYSFHSGGGISAPDTAGTHPGKLTGSAEWGEGFTGAHSLQLNGGGYVDIPSPVIDTSQSYTVTAWVKLNSIGGYQTFVSIDGSHISGFFLQLRDDTRDFAFTVPGTDVAGGDVAIASSTDAPDQGQWYHLAGVYDSKEHTVSLYVNGKIQQTVPAPQSFRAEGDTYIGRAKYNGPVDYVHGLIDDVRFYQSALTAEQIREIVQPNLSRAGILGFVGNIPPAVLEVNPSSIISHVSPSLYGLMTEEISHSYDGGLYGELIQNRIFKDDPKSPVHWSLVEKSGGKGFISLDNNHPINSALTTSLLLDASVVNKGQGVGIANDGFWGIPVKPHTQYRASFYALANPDFAGALTVSLESSDGSTVYARNIVPHIGSEWKRYALLLTTRNVTATSNCRFVIASNTAGTIRFNLVSLFPPTYHNRPDGNRPDIMRLLSAMKPAFLRLPGGNYLEGDTIPERFDWKKTIHGLDQRPGHQGPWGYRSSDGMGLLEFLEWCEDLKMNPLLAVYAGYSLGGQYVSPGAPLAPFVQSALDEIEYITGSVHTYWGKERAKDGHPAPFPLHYVEIGNEDWFDKSGSYDARFAQFYDAIKANYPNIQIIATAPVHSRIPDVLDEHFYLSPLEMERGSHRYDSYNRKGPKIFVGEWASEEGRPTPDMNAALGDAAWLTGLERNSDIVIMESYAPLLVNVNIGARQWGTNLIGYDALHAYGSPSYYAQLMFSAYHGDEVPESSLSGGKRLNYSITKDSKSGALYLKVVNPIHAPQTMEIKISGDQSISSEAKEISLSSLSPQDTNSITDRTKIVPIHSRVEGVSDHFHIQFPAYSITVLVIRK